MSTPHGGGRPRRGGRLVLLLPVATLLACPGSFPNSPSTALPVVQVLLIAGDTVQTAWVEWQVPAESAFGPDVRPVDPALVTLSLTLPSGGEVSFNPAPGTPGRFAAQTSIEPGGGYSLHGTVNGMMVTGSTIVPDSLEIRVPLQDTVDIPLDSCFAVCPVSYHWAAQGADAYLVVQTRRTSSGTEAVTQSSSTRDTAGVIQAIQTTGGPDSATLTILALDHHAAAFLEPANPKSSLSGVFGFLGAATRSRRWVVWR